MRHQFDLLALIVGATAFGGVSAAQSAPGDVASCFRDLVRGRGAEIICELPIRPSEAETAELQRQSRGLLKGAACKVSIRVSRAEIEAALKNPDHEFLAAPQPVACDVTTAGRSGDMQLPISATFAPKVIIKDGKAVDATPGLDNIQGVPRPVSWPVQYWVNSGSYVKTQMLQIVNAWLDYLRGETQRRADMRR